MVQHVLVAPEQSLSPEQNCSPWEGCAQTFRAPGASDRATQACPAEVLQSALVLQKCWQLPPGWQTFSPEP
jgi:hypothetical protein